MITMHNYIRLYKSVQKGNLEIKKCQCNSFPNLALKTTLILNTVVLKTLEIPRWCLASSYKSYASSYKQLNYSVQKYNFLLDTGGYFAVFSAIKL